MNYCKFLNWISRKIKVSSGTRNTISAIYLIFLIASARKHTITAAAKFAGLPKSRFHYFLNNNSDIAIYTLTDLSKKQARQFSKTMKALSDGKLPWNIAISIDATIQHRSSLHTENCQKFNHGNGFVVGHQWTNIVLHIGDKIIPLTPIPFHTKKYCKKEDIGYETENELVVKYINDLSLKEYIGSYAPNKVVVLCDSGYDDHRIQKAIAKKRWKFIIALKSSRGVKTEAVYKRTKKSEDWTSVSLSFKNNRKIGWKTIRILTTNSGKKKWMEFRTRQIIGYIKNFGKAQLICSEFKTKNSKKGKRKHFACNDLKATPRQIILGYRLRWRIEIFHKEIKMFLGFEDVSAKWFSSIKSHVHWVYCAYILLNWSPPEMPKEAKSLMEKQQAIDKMIKKRHLSSVAQILTQAKGPQKLKNLVQKALNGCSDHGNPIIHGLEAF